ncbi:MAG: hypothetical protein HOC23_16735 [Halieaceae bacterium]|jgi:hypothetical protein|nr:hypothetical protein [Halieaceae bacterium]
MLTAKNLERVMDLEAKLRSEYQVQLDAKSTEIASAIKKQEEQKTIIAKQLDQISTLSTQATANKHMEQLNRELTQRGENLQEEVSKQKKRAKTLQKDLAEERTEVKALKQFDGAKMKKNLAASKKKLVEKTTANDLLQKSVNKYKAENAELQTRVKELEAKLEELESAAQTDEPEEEEAAA